MPGAIGATVNAVRLVNAMALRPFRQIVDLPTAFGVLALLLVATGMMHLILERVDMPSGADLVPE